MDCTEFLDRYSEYDDSLVPPWEADRFRSHMAACASCTRYDRVLRKGRMVARQLPRVEPSDDFVLRLRARLWQRSGGGDRLLERPARSTHALAAITVVLALTALFGLMGSRGMPVTDELLAADGAAATWRPLPARASDPEYSDASLHVRIARTLPPLPAMPATAHRPWTAERVDREVQSSYSPLITGPPVYRGAGARSAISIPTHRTLD